MSEAGQATLTAQSDGDCLYKNPDWLRQKYHGEGANLREVADAAGVSKSTIRRMMVEFGIPRRHEKNHTAAAPKTNSNGHRELDHNCTLGRWSVMIHRLHATLLVDDLNEMEGKIVHHLNGCPFDNRLENYELVSAEEHRERHGFQQCGQNGLCRECGVAVSFTSEYSPNYCPECGERYAPEEVVESTSINWEIPH
jgi:hypothetical protein